MLNFHTLPRILNKQHDTQVGQSLERWVSSGFKPLAYALILMRVDGYPCVFYGDLYGTKGENPQQPVSQLEDLIRCRKWFAYGEQREYWDHREYYLLPARSAEQVKQWIVTRLQVY